MKSIPLALLAFVLLAAGGCAPLIAPLSDASVDRFHGKRTLGARIEDQSIEFKVRVDTRRNAALPSAARVVPVSWNGQVLLAGQVPTAGVAEEVAKTAAAIRHVQHVHNELEISERSSLLVRLNDSWITCRVKGRLLFGPDVPGRRIKVVTENGVVYLMGLVDHLEAEQAVDAARKAYGVQKIVKIFEYIDASNP